jgi:phosphoribosylaminoimidazole carboxylase (NCAIR synthetase)
MVSELFFENCIGKDEKTRKHAWIKPYDRLQVSGVYGKRKAKKQRRMAQQITQCRG